MSESAKEMPSRQGKAFDKKSVNGEVVKGLSAVSITRDIEHLEPGDWDLMPWGCFFVFCFLHEAFGQKLNVIQIPHYLLYIVCNIGIR